MTRYRTRIVKLGIGGVIAAVIAGGVAGSAYSQSPQQAAPPAPYRPGMGDFMTGGVQPRHIKLAAAGQTGNWDYAAYALKEMGETFDRIVRAYPTYRTKPTADLIATFVKGPLADIDAAIKARDAGKFKTAYTALTQACNACHVATDRAMVVIKDPGAVTSYPDQEFGATK